MSVGIGFFVARMPSVPVPTVGRRLSADLVSSPNGAGAYCVNVLRAYIGHASSGAPVYLAIGVIHSCS